MLYESNYQEEIAEPGGADKTHPGDKLEAVLETTGNIDLNGGSQHETETMTDKGDNTILQTKPSKKHSGDDLQDDMLKPPKTEEDLTSESDAVAHSTEMEQEPKTTRKTCDKGDSQDMDHALTSGQDRE